MIPYHFHEMDDVIQIGGRYRRIPHATSKDWYMSEYHHPYVPITLMISQISHPSPTTRLEELSRGCRRASAVPTASLPHKLCSSLEATPMYPQPRLPHAPPLLLESQKYCMFCNTFSAPGQKHTLQGH